VQLTGNRFRPKVPGVEHERASTCSKAASPREEAYVDSCDWFDSDFAEMYPEHKWVTDSVLRFGYKLAQSEQSKDTVTISNRSDKPVRYLKITAGDMLFIFDLPARSATKLAVPHQGWHSWVTAEGAFPTDSHFCQRSQLLSP
jgi:hypothetical protein